MRQCWAHRPEERPRFTVIVETLSRLHERLVDGNETSSSEESEFEEEEPRYTIQPRGSGGRRYVLLIPMYNVLCSIHAVTKFVPAYRYIHSIVIIVYMCSVPLRGHKLEDILLLATYH